MKRTLLSLLSGALIVTALGAASLARAEMYLVPEGTALEPTSEEHLSSFLPLMAGLANTGEPTSEKRWSSFLPLMADEAKNRGYELPLPFGVSTVFLTLLNRDVKITDVRVGVNGAPPRSVSRFLDLGSKTDVVLNANLKLDAWLLPFLDLYLLAGYVFNETTTRANITTPGPSGSTFSTEFKTRLSGFVGGVGMTLAGGYNNFIMVFDVNWAQTDIGFDDRFRAVIATLRAGWNGKVGSNPLQLWLGEGYWNTTNTAKSTVNVPGTGTIQFQADQGPKYPWMTDAGANFWIAKNFMTVLDFGFDYHGGYAIVVAPTYRF